MRGVWCVLSDTCRVVNSAWRIVLCFSFGVNVHVVFCILCSVFDDAFVRKAMFCVLRRVRCVLPCAALHYVVCCVFLWCGVLNAVL